MHNVSGKASLVDQMLTIISSTTSAILATRNRHFPTSRNVLSCTLKKLPGFINDSGIKEFGYLWSKLFVLVVQVAKIFRFNAH